MDKGNGLFTPAQLHARGGQSQLVNECSGCKRSEARPDGQAKIKGILDSAMNDKSYHFTGNTA